MKKCQHSYSLQKKNSDWDEDTHILVESQFEDVATAVETCMNTMEESTVDHE